MVEEWHEFISKPRYNMKVEKNIHIPMRDGVRLAADIYYPDGPGPFPALLSLSCYGKEMQRLPVPDYPSDPLLGNGGIEAGDSEYFASRGYIHVIADSRGTNFSEGAYRVFTIEEQRDGYDLVEWIGNQPGCNGNVGMLGLSYFGMIQYLVAAQRPPHLKAICPVDASTDLYRHFDYHGGILNLSFLYQWWGNILAHTLSALDISAPELAPMVEDLKKNEDIESFPSLYKTLLFPEKNPHLYDVLVHPLDGPFYWERSASTKLDRIDIPCFIISRWTAQDMHLPGAFEAYCGIKSCHRKLMMTVPESGFGFTRPWHENYDVIVRWYDHWLKGIDTGFMNEPPIRLLVQGSNEWRYEQEWPLERTKWTKLYLRGKELLSDVPPADHEGPASFTNKRGLKPGQEVPSVQYTTIPLEYEIEITGPISLYFYASLSDKDADWYAVINDIDRDGAARLVSKGWLRASHLELDESKSKPYQPFHSHRKLFPIEKDKPYRYSMGIRETSYLFRAGHRIQVKIKGQDAPWEGKSYMRFTHLPRSRESLHTIHHDSERPSYLLLPIIPK